MAKPKLNLSRDDLRALLDADLNDRGMSQSDLARTLGVTPQNVSVWVLRANIPARHWIRIAEILGEQSRFARLVNLAPEDSELPELQRRLHLTDQKVVSLQTQVNQLSAQLERYMAMHARSPGVANRQPV